MTRMNDSYTEWVEDIWNSDFTNPYVRDLLGDMVDEIAATEDKEFGEKMIDNYNNLREESMAQINELIFGCLDYC